MLARRVKNIRRNIRIISWNYEKFIFYRKSNKLSILRGRSEISRLIAKRKYNMGIKIEFDNILTRRRLSCSTFSYCSCLLYLNIDRANLLDALLSYFSVCMLYLLFSSIIYIFLFSFQNIFPSIKLKAIQINDK